MKKTFIILSLMVFLLVPFQGYTEGWFWHSADPTEEAVEVIVEPVEVVQQSVEVVEESVEVVEETTDTPEESLDDTNNSEQ